MRRLVFGSLLLCVPCCDPGGPSEPEGASVTVRLVNPAGVERPESLRVAVVFRTGQLPNTPSVTTFDHAVDDGTESQRVVLELPKGADLAGSPDSVTIAVACAEPDATKGWPGLRPWVVVYQDRDGNRYLDGAGVDRVWGVADQQIAAFVDLETAVAQMSIEGAECLQESTLGGFSPFVLGTLGGTGFAVSQVASSEVELSLSPSTYPGALLRCGSSLQLVSPPTPSSVLLSVAPDTGLEVCTGNRPACTSAAYQEDWRELSQWVSTSGYYRYPRCVVTRGLSILWVGEQRYECDGCLCTQELKERGWIVLREATPHGWPCGETVEVCSTTVDDVEVIPAACALN